MDSPAELQSTTHLVGHLIREVEEAVLDVLLPRDFVKPENDGHKARIRAVLRTLGLDEQDHAAQLWLSLPGDGGLHRTAHRDALFAPRPVDSEFLRQWDALQTVLDFVLGRFRERYLDYHQILDEIAAVEHPTRAHAKELKNRAPNNLVAHGYFFDKVTSAEWLAPLAAEGFFRRPPEPERDGDLIRFVPWPQARYLARVAPEVPKAVTDVIMAIPDTDNIRTLTDLTEAAYAMPAGQAVRLVDKAKVWAASPYAALMLLPERLGRLTAHLADGGYVDEALDLARTVLALKHPAWDGDGPTAEAGPHVRKRPDATLHDWEYKEILRLRVPALVRAAAIEALRLLCDLLAEALTVDRGYEPKGANDERFREDYSYIWRPRLPAEPHIGSEDILNALVSAARDTAVQIAREQPDLLEPVVAELEGRGWVLFWRISLDIVREAADAGLGVACARLTDGALANEQGLQPEFPELLASAFASLSRDCQGRILQLIEGGPDTSRLQEDLDNDWYGRRWRWQMLAAIKDSLPAEWEAQWQQLSAEFGEALELPREGPVAAYWGRPEVVGVEKLRAMPLAEVRRLTENFEPRDGFLEPSSEDLAGELAQAVAADPDRFATELSVFHDASSVYQGGLAHGFRDAAEAGSVFDWGPVLDLCLRIISRGDALAEKEAATARRQAVDLLHSGLAPRGAEIPFEFRESVWTVLEPLLNDPDPSPESETEGSGFGPVGRAINSTRGRAVEAAIFYGLWVYRGKRPPSGDDRAFGLDDAPELRAALERRLDPAVDPSLAVRSVFGMYLPILYGLDAAWVTGNIAQLFPREPATASVRQAAWEGYVSYSRFNLSMLDLLRDEYAISIEHLGSAALEERGRPDEHLGHHLMAYFWHGRLALDDPLLIRFFEIAFDSVRAQALAWVGQSLRDADESIADDVGTRLRALWEWRVETANAGASADHKEEMAAFGWTFASEALGDAWGLAQLGATLGIVGQTAIDHEVGERLASAAPGYPLETVRCLSLMVDGATEDWQIHHWAAHAETILAAALQSDDDEASGAARALINGLGARGFLGFSTLLE